MVNDEEFKEINESQKKEMEDFRWIESEKAGHDVGKGIYLEWITSYAALWRDHWNETHPDKRK